MARPPDNTCCSMYVGPTILSYSRRRRPNSATWCAHSERPQLWPAWRQDMPKLRPTEAHSGNALAMQETPPGTCMRVVGTPVQLNGRHHQGRGGRPRSFSCPNHILEHVGTLGAQVRSAALHSICLRALDFMHRTLDGGGITGHPNPRGKNATKNRPMVAMLGGNVARLRQNGQIARRSLERGHASQFGIGPSPPVG